MTVYHGLAKHWALGLPWCDSGCVASWSQAGWRFWQITRGQPALCSHLFWWQAWELNIQEISQWCLKQMVEIKWGNYTANIWQDLPHVLRTSEYSWMSCLSICDVMITGICESLPVSNLGAQLTARVTNRFIFSTRLVWMKNFYHLSGACSSFYWTSSSTLPSSKTMAAFYLWQHCRWRLTTYKVC